jgi:hypothetical protein
LRRQHGQALGAGVVQAGRSMMCLDRGEFRLDGRLERALSGFGSPRHGRRRLV